jgi:RNA polymerase sigma factor (TIGR02999 family)
MSSASRPFSGQSATFAERHAAVHQTGLHLGNASAGSKPRHGVLLKACNGRVGPAIIGSASPLAHAPAMLHSPSGEITQLIIAMRAGSSDALERLLPLVYGELRRMAHRALRRERQGHTLSTTALVHEAYLKLVNQQRANLHDRAHFLAVAATAMRRVLVDYARQQKRLKRGGERRAVELTDAMLVAEQRADELLALDDALSKLSRLNDRLSRVVECRFFAGLTVEETAAVLQVTTRTVERDWQKARAWLYIRLRGGAPDSGRS